VLGLFSLEKAQGNVTNVHLTGGSKAGGDSFQTGQTALVDPN